MDAEKQARLERAGWRVGSADALLRLAPEESMLISIRLSLSGALKRRRAAAGLTQAQLARRLGSSQSRVARMEAADPSVSLDLLVRGYLALGATAKDLALALAEP